MKSKIYKATWGMDNIPTLEEKLRMISEAGYDGAELSLEPGGSLEELKSLLEKYNLSCIYMIFAAKIEEIEEQLKIAAELGSPHANSHSGRDKMTFEEGCDFFRAALDAEQKIGIPIAHETHRHRMFFSPWSTAAYLREFPDLKITADFSHWCVVCESILEDFEEELELAISRSIHIHGRVGHEEGPQVADPAAPEAQRYLERHEVWWDKIRRNLESSGADLFTYTPEFGPPGYMPTLPFTRQPVADLWDVCLWMANRERKRWGL